MTVVKSCTVCGTERAHAFADGRFECTCCGLRSWPADDNPVVSLWRSMASAASQAAEAHTAGEPVVAWSGVLDEDAAARGKS